MDCFGAPQDILATQTSDQRSHFLADGWTALLPQNSIRSEYAGVPTIREIMLDLAQTAAIDFSPCRRRPFIHPLPRVDREWIKLQLPGTPPITPKYQRAEIFPVKRNVHPWMRGTFAVLRNSHYFVTGDDGSFTLLNLRPGKYTITAWHEYFGDQSQEVTVTGRETSTINFRFKAKTNYY